VSVVADSRLTATAPARLIAVRPQEDDTDSPAGLAVTSPESVEQPSEAAIPTVMRALVKATAGPGAELRDVPVPTPGTGEVLVRVEAASLCGTDLHIYRWDAWAQERLAGRLPQIFGHEMAGRVVAYGPATPATVPLGSRVGAESHLVDGTCYQCRTGRQHICRNLRILGVDADGAFAEYIVLPVANLWPSDGLTPEIAAIQEPMGNAVLAAFAEEITGETVLVTGCGPIGLMAIAISRLAGASQIFATDINPERRALAKALGADVVLDGASPDVVERIRAMTHGDGVDVVLEMSGAEPAIRQGFAAVTNGGRVSLLGLPSRPVTLDLNNDIIFKGVRVYGITGRRMYETWYRTSALLAQGLDLSLIVTHQFPLTQFAEAFELLAAGHAGKVVLLPQEA